MNAKDIMTSPVITVMPDTAVHDVAELLLERSISGVPVVAHGEIVGMVNEGDLLQRHEIGTDGCSLSKRSWWARLMEHDDASIQYVKAHGRKVKDVMGRHVVPVAEDTPARQLASIFAARHIRRLPVLRGRQMVGIVTRADLIRALAKTAQGIETSHAEGDEAIRTRLLRELKRQRWWRPDWSAVYVENGVVHYHGLIRSVGERQAARVAAENVPGVRGVEDERVSGVGWHPML